MEAGFDAIVIGGGHNGQILGAYLQKSGLDTLVLERRMEPGGGLCTEEATLPGFYHNLHSFFLRWVPDLPWYQDLELEQFGVRMIMPPVQTVTPFSDGRALILHTDLDATYRSIAHFSKADANTFRDLWQRFEAINRRIIVPETYAPPLDFEIKKEILAKSELGREYLSISAKTPMDLARDLFVSEEMRALVLFLVTTRMFLPDEPGLGYSVVSAIIGGLKGALCRGGSHNLAHGLAACLEANGARVWEASHVREVIVDGNRATGVILDDGRRIMARKAVVSAVDVPQTYLELVGADKLPGETVAQAKAFKFAKWGLFGVHLALNEPLQYQAAGFDPHTDHGLNYNIGLESLDDLTHHLAAIDAKRPPPIPGMQCAHPTRHDPLQAPDHKHTAFLWQFAPYELATGGVAAWDSEKEAYMAVCLDRWRRYAPNLDDDNILARYIFTPLDVERKLINMRYGDHCVGRASRDQMLESRPFPGQKPYRTPIEGLYLCGSGTHPFGNITGAPGYNAARVICEDLDLLPWWRPIDPHQLWKDLD